jgi:Dynamin family/Dynamin central region
LQPVSDSTALQRSQNATPESQANGYPLSSSTSQPLTQAEKIKAMVRCVNNLRYLGVESEVPLPKICVVGDQSAGKSSLIEALSGISVPRAEGCCTRCPLEVNLISKDGLWECQVFLMKSYDYLTDSKTSHKASRKHPMGRWSPRGGSEAHPFGVTMNRHEVHDLIHRAQLAILNPSADLARYIPSGDTEISSNLEVKFSPNIIRLDIQGPEYCNLSFTDLPGIIAMPEVKSEQFLVDVVANLTKDHIGRRSSIVILTLPMTTDVENSKAFALIQEHNAEERTLGVLTKPDRVQSQGELTRWQEMLLDNSSFRLGHGFHAVMMHPDTKLSREAALGQEAGFFDRGDWQPTKLAAPGKLGIQSLTLGLESLLATKIAKELPNIMNKVNERSEAIQHELRSFPARPSVDRYQFELGQLISRFGFGLNSLFEGHGRGAGAGGLKRKWSLLAREFREALLTSRPSLEVCSAAERKAMTKFRATSKPSTPQHTSRPSEKLPAAMEISSDDESSKFADFKKPVGSFTLEDVEECNEQRNSTHIPGQIAPPAIEYLNCRSVEHWHKLTSKFVVHVGKMVREEVKTLAAEVFSEYQNTDMYIVVLNAVEDFLEKALQDQKVEVVKASRME